MAEAFIHPAVAHELGAPAGSGDRHNQMKRLLPLLLGDGHSPEGIFACFRGMYGQDIPDREIWRLINWGTKKDFTPSRFGAPEQTRSRGCRRYILEREQKNFEPLTPEQKIRRWIRNTENYLNGFRALEVDLWEASPIRLFDDFTGDARLLLSHLYHPHELVNINADYRLSKDGKVDIVGAGLTKTAQEWTEYLLSNPFPQSAAGCWIRMNPVKSIKGSGAGGSFTDSDIAAYRFILLENDRLPLDLQFSLFVRLKVPIAMILDSGGRSYHAWVRSWAQNPIEYRAEADYLIELLERFGIDRGNKNPSRFSRLPGVMRVLGGRNVAGLPGPGQAAQRILFLNPSPIKAKSIESMNLNPSS